MSSWVAGVTVFFTSGAVLVLEILALRLLAPYIGVTLEAYTATIATVLAGISVGTWVGGYAADRLEPRRLLGPLMLAGGGLSMLAVPLVRMLGSSSGASAVGLSLVGFFAPAAVLSAVAPTVVKLQLQDLAATGRVVGRLSALGTAGAITGTYLAGFVLVEAVPTSTSILVVGGGLMLAGMVMWLWLWRKSLGVATAVAILGVAGTGLGAATAETCDVETVYHCARVVDDASRRGGRLLVLDTVRHSYVDLDDPTHLQFDYARVFADVISAAAPPGPLRVLHVGGGGFTLPRYLRAVRPGSTSTVLEIDPGLVQLSREHLGLNTGPDLDVRIGDARLLLRSVDRAVHDLVLGDAFGGLAVPWHLTTEEFLVEVRATLHDGGIYLMNLIDYPPMRFARAEVATLARVFDDVAAIAPPDVFDGRGGGNVVLVASVGALSSEHIATAIADRQGDEVVLSGAAVRDFAEGASALVDDWAPVDQWLSRSRRP
ncbi:MAG: fused MFS/spermidine synthase [Actinomycetota bacterium]|nr:fused MFS/spermidine synthase [Actinomycetota bacterium]